MKKPLLQIKGLHTHFLTKNRCFTAINNLDLDIFEGEILGLVGESGCGKSVTANSILRLLDERNVAYEGKILFQNKDILTLNHKELREFRRREVGMVFQDPQSCLNPLLSIGYQLVEAIRINEKISKKEALRRAEELLILCEITESKQRLKAYAHELSGGIKQRIMIAMAIAKRPKLLIADEPTTALDVTIQSQILKIFKNLNTKFNTTCLFITHDLSIVESLCHRVGVMYEGRLVEEGLTSQIFRHPQHLYTKGLLKARPMMHHEKSTPLYTINHNELKS